jgi:hypothetical protein
MKLSERLNPREAAEYLGGFTVNTLSVWRTKGTGPEYIRAGRNIFYLKEDLDSWLLSNKHRNTSEYLGGEKNEA